MEYSEGNLVIVEGKDIHGRRKMKVEVAGQCGWRFKFRA
jgi:hypothetical protein